VVLKTHQFLQPLVNFEYGAKRASDEDSNFDIFEMTSEINEHSKKLMRQELDLFRKYPNIKNIKCPLDWWAKHESMFPIVAFLTC